MIEHTVTSDPIFQDAETCERIKSTFRVHIRVDYEDAVEVDADTEEEAVECALEIFNDTSYFDEGHVIQVEKVYE